MTRILMTLAALIALGACAVPDPELEAPVDLGDFRLLGNVLLGSGLFRDRDQQMANLAAQFSKAVERWLVANGDLFGVGVSDEALEAAKADDAAEIANQLQAEEAAESN